MTRLPTYERDVLDLLDRAAIPTTCPPILRPEHVERVLNLTTAQRHQLEKVGWLTPASRTPGGHARYAPADIARAILTRGIKTYWERLE